MGVVCLSSAVFGAVVGVVCLSGVGGCLFVLLVHVAFGCGYTMISCCD